MPTAYQIYQTNVKGPAADVDFSCCALRPMIEARDIEVFFGISKIVFIIIQPHLSGE